MWASRDQFLSGPFFVDAGDEIIFVIPSIYLGHVYVLVACPTNTGRGSKVRQSLFLLPRSLSGLGLLYVVHGVLSARAARGSA
jgi:hypothetical protein